ncbi:MAG: hypothetical protein IJ595_07535 [Oscillospiraceae bacterium]|nr:hypothetical protein [Oscillospiraceae bacterium]
MQKLWLFLERRAEVLALIVLAYFAPHLSAVFTFMYGFALTAGAVWKLLHPPMSPSTLTGLCTFLGEISGIFMAYEHAPLFCVFITGFFVVFFRLIRNAPALPGVRTNALLLLIGSLAGYLIGAFVGKVWCIAFTEAVFVSAILLLPQHPLSVLAALAVSGAMLLLVGETGTAMVLILTAAALLLLHGSMLTKYLTCLTGATSFAAWVFVYLNDGMYQRLWRLSADASWRRMLQRLFFDYQNTDQLVLLRRLADRGLRDRLFLLIAPAEPVQIVTNSTSTYTAVSDFCYSLMQFSMGFYPMILVAAAIILYAAAVNHHRHSRLAVIPLLLLFQTVIHVFGNKMLFPFSGIPLPFLSYADSFNTLFFLMAALLTCAELQGEEP